MTLTEERPAAAPPSEANLLEVRNLKKYFPITRGIFRRVVGQVRAVDDVSFAIPRGKTLGLVGESGCGKTTTSRMIMRAFDPTSGDIMFNDPGMGWVNVPALGPADVRRLRPNMQMIFQDPYSIPSGCSFHPRCPFYKPGVCDDPDYRQIAAGHWVRCNRAEELSA